jgi:hypothetical protein
MADDTEIRLRKIAGRAAGDPPYTDQDIANEDACFATSAGIWAAVVAAHALGWSEGIALAERLRAAGDALADMVRRIDSGTDVVSCLEISGEWYQDAGPALAGWAAARGGSGGEGGAEAAQREGDDR